MDTIFVIMLKDKKTGFFEKELASLPINKNDNLIVNLFAQGGEDDKKEIVMKITTDRNVEDWEFSAIFDYYDTEIYNGIVNKISEIEDMFNPTWEVIFDFTDDLIDMEDKISEILNIHKNELEDVYETIKNKESEYADNE